MDKTLIIKGVPQEIHSEFKARCAIAGVTMREQIIESMRNFVKCKKYLNPKERSR